ncbi:MAG: aspartate-semialdehyde dehydrogenase [candidate division WOR-3 bacterium]|nr:MAG: aspartate-semialdehyde dehydrogenase [candidate division WOR-3 bacterium]
MKNTAVLGIDSLIGKELVQLLEQRDYPTGDVYFMAADHDRTQPVVFKGREVEVFNDYRDFTNKVDLAFCCLDRVAARDAAQAFKDAFFIDCSRAFSFVPDIVHIIPEVNADMISAETDLVANPSPLTIQSLLALYPLHKTLRLKHLQVVALVPVSELGQDAVDELSYEYEFLAVGNRIEKTGDRIFPYSIASNVIPQVGDIMDDGCSEEEEMFAKEVSIILKTEKIRIGATAAWVPIQRVGCAAVTAAFEKRLSLDDVRGILQKAPGVMVIEDSEKYPMPENAAGKDEVFVGRLRRDRSFENGITMWIATDNLRKGSALNAVQIAELT